MFKNTYLTIFSFLFLFANKDIYAENRIVPCKELPDALKLVAKNCPQPENYFNKFDKTYTYNDVEKYKKDLELNQLKMRLDEQEMRIEMQRRIAIKDKIDLEENRNKPIVIFDSQSGQSKSCFRIGETISCN
jgi:hypothetical protein